ncbi:MAG: cadmium-translocating P-type ATPase [Ruminococcaceae bacterium]|nr:cadmium-translocating P-type ATPase [Oscillospiraceae bacterium]
MNKKQKKLLFRILISFALTALLLVVPVSGVYRFICYFAVYLVIGFDILRKAAKGILNGRVFDENFLMSIATLGAFALAIYTKSGDYLEGVAVMLFYCTGELFQSLAVGKSRKSIAALMDIRPDRANLKTENGVVTVSPQEIRAGDIILVDPGEKIPLDGVVLKGASSLNTSALTGESIPRDVSEGDEVISGCVNMTGALEVRVTKAYEDSTVNKILELVSSASSKKSRFEAFISRFARVYTPIVCGCAAALALVPPSINMLLSLPAGFDIWLYRALTFLVVSCPCALVISVPLSFFAGLGCASKNGILIKGSNYLEALSKTEYMVFDKTGTLTKGEFSVTDIVSFGISQEELLRFAAYCECASSHPIAQSLKKAYGKSINRDTVRNIKELAGRGVTAETDGKVIAVGNADLMEEAGAAIPSRLPKGNSVHVALDGVYAGYLLISDTVKENSAKALGLLKKAGIKKTVMLTGDNAFEAKRISDTVGTDEFKSGLYPHQKVEAVEEYLLQKPKRSVLAFVGDGINDAPVLSRADVGIAMGAMGSDAAIEAADVVLMDDDPMQLVSALKISRKCVGIVYGNIAFSLLVKFSCLALTAFGVSDMWFAIFADVGVMILAVLNAMRAFYIKK